LLRMYRIFLLSSQQNRPNWVIVRL